MSSIQSSGNAPQPELLVAAREQFERTRRTLREVLARIEAGDAKAVPELEGCRVQLSKALNNAIEQESRFDEFCKTRCYGATSPELDLDAARAEIGRRLARLRAASEGGGVSGGAE